MKYILTILFLIFTNLTFAQWEQKGQVLEINSGSKGVANVQILYEGAIATDTDDNGFFNLSFKDGYGPGADAFLTSISKKGYAVVNLAELEVVQLSDSNKFPKSITVAKKGVIDAARTTWAQASKENLTKKYRLERDRITKDLNAVKISLTEKEALLAKLRSENERLLKQIYPLADRLARTNLDENPRYKEALDYFKQGDIDGTIKILESLKPVEQIASGIKSKLEAEVQIKEGLKIARDLGDFYSLNFNKEKAIEQYEAIYKVGFNNVDVLYDIAEFYSKIRYYKKSVEVHKRLINHPNAPSYIRTLKLFSVGALYNNLGQPDNAASSFKSAIDGLEKLLKKYPKIESARSVIGLCYMYLGIIESDRKNLDLAYDYFSKYHLIERELVREFPTDINYLDNFASSYKFLGEIEQERGHFLKAREQFLLFKDKSREIYEQLPKAYLYKASYVEALDRLGELELELDNIEKSREYYLLAKKLGTEVVQDHSKQIGFTDTVGGIILALGNIEYRQKNFSEAQQYYIEYNTILERLNKEIEFNFIFKANLATSYYHLKKMALHESKVDLALDYNKKMLLIYQELFQINPTFNNLSEKFGNAYYSLLLSYLLLDDQPNLEQHYSDFSSYGLIDTPYKVLEVLTTKVNTSKTKHIAYVVLSHAQKAEGATLESVSQSLNSAAWYGMLSGYFEEADQLINEALALEVENKFLHTNLPVAILLQGGRFKEAKKLYRTWKDKPFNEQGFATYKEVFLDDLKTFQEHGIIPEEVAKDVQKIKSLLNE